ncbi:MAG: hypothetical protein JSU74_01565 [Candidatus Zixiibacteriota bacterium]|nr:MAG: hypothetical protein JSU74_01565 [candidate division Zixibacteria bacterium]
MNSRLVENNKEYLIQTTNDIQLGSVSSEVFVNGTLADAVRLPHPEQIKPEEVLSIVKATHSDKKKEVESLLKAYRDVMDGGNPQMMYHLGLAFYYKMFVEEARDLLLAATSLDSEFHEAFNVLGQIELALSNFQLSIAAAEKAVRIRPEYADYRNNLGEAYLAARRLKEAQREFDKAIEINLYYSDAYFNYGLALLVEALGPDKAEVLPNLVSKAVDYFTKASLTNPDYNNAAFERGLDALKAQEAKHGFKLMKSVRESKKIEHGRRYALYHLKYALYPQWITEKAVADRISFLQEEVTKNPGYVDLYIELSRCYLEQARISWKKGIDSYRKTLEINSALEKVAAYVDRAEDAYEAINEVIGEIDKKG